MQKVRRSLKRVMEDYVLRVIERHLTPNVHVVHTDATVWNRLLRQRIDANDREEVREGARGGERRRRRNHTAVQQPWIERYDTAGVDLPVPRWTTGFAAESVHSGGTGSTHREGREVRREVRRKVRVLESPPDSKLTEGLLPSMLCPITREPMQDPVQAADGHSYERSAIIRWFREGKCTSPMTNEQMEMELVENHALREVIAEWSRITRKETVRDVLGAVCESCV